MGSISPQSYNDCGGSWFFEEDFSKLIKAKEHSLSLPHNQVEVQAKIESCLKECLKGLLEICANYEIELPTNELKKAQSENPILNQQESMKDP